MTIAPWLQRHLETTGRWNADGIARKAKIRIHTCRQTVIVGLDADTAARAVICDTDPLTPLGEALALLGGRNTYTLRSALGIQLDHRTDFHIRGEPAAITDRTQVVAEHICGSPPLPHFDHPTSEPTGCTDDPPF